MGKQGETVRNKIVVGADLSETGDNAIREAMRLTLNSEQSELHVTYVVPTEGDVHGAKRIEQLSGVLRTKFDDLRNRVASVCAPLPDAPPFSREVVLHVRIGDPAAALHQVAVDVDADMIVVGTHGRRGIERMVLGSVAETLVRTAHVPVVVARPKDLGGLAKSAHPEAPRPGQEVHDVGLTNRVHMEFRPRTSHISGLV